MYKTYKNGEHFPLTMLQIITSFHIYPFGIKGMKRNCANDSSLFAKMPPCLSRKPCENYILQHRYELNLISFRNVF